MSILGFLDLEKSLSSILGGGTGGSTGGGTGGGTSGTGTGVGLGGGVLSPVSNLISNITGSGTDGLLGGVLDLGLLNDKGVVQLTVLGNDLIVLPNNAGIIHSDLLGPGGLGGGGLGGLTQIIKLDGLLSDAGLLNLTGLLDNGVLSLGGLLGEVLKLLSPTGTIDPDDPIDPDGEVDPDAFEHQLIGTSGRDIFTIPTQSTYVDGLGDIDIANFARSAEGMGFAVGRNGVVFADGETVFFMRDVERVSFLEGTLLLDTGAGENAGMAYRIYQAAFNRTPDVDGLAYWLATLDSGAASLSAIADSFIHSPEFVQKYGTTESVSNAEFVGRLYLHTLGRTADTVGFDYWVNRLDNDLTKGDLLAQFTESPENQQRVAAQIDNGIWLA
jgi:hypothetical protein